MNQSRCRTWPTLPGAVLLAMLTGAVAGAPTLSPSPEDQAMASRLVEVGQLILRAPQQSKDHWQQAAALLEMALRYDRTEPRYLLQAAEAMTRSQDYQGALQAWQAFRDIYPEDQAAQVESIRLRLTLLENLEERLKYARQLAEQSGLDAEVRSVAWTAVGAILLEKKAQPDQIDQALEEALRLNPLNLDALTLKYRILPADAPPAQRAEMLLRMIRSNPTQPTTMVELAELLANQGLARESAWWYGNANLVLTKMGSSLPPDLAVAHASELLLSDQATQAQKVAEQVLAADNGHYPTLLLRMLMEKQVGQMDSSRRLRSQARNALINRLAAVRKALGDQTATTRPVTDSVWDLPDLSRDPELLANTENAEAKKAYGEILADLSWFEGHLNESKESALRLSAQLIGSMGEDDPLAVRMAGWRFLWAQKLDEAKVKLTAVADQDVLAALGLVEAYAAAGDKPAAAAAAQKLIDQHRGGLLAVLLQDLLRDHGARWTASEAAPQVAKALSAFPQDLLRIVQTPEKFFMLHAEPVQTAVRFSEPMLVRVMIRNVSEYDLTVGANGVLRPDLWFDGSLVGVVQQPLVGIAVERFTGPLVLRPQQKITLVARMDLGSLGQSLSDNPTPPVQVRVTVRTNPIIAGGKPTSGPAGISQVMVKLLERRGHHQNDEGFAAIESAITGGPPEEKLRNIDLMAAYIDLYNKVEMPGGTARAAALAKVLARAAKDRDQRVRCWAVFMLTLRTELDDQPAMLEAMLRDASPLMRLLGMVAVQGLRHKGSLPLVEQLAQSDPDPTVRRFGSAAVALAEAAARNPAPAGR